MGVVNAERAADIARLARGRLRRDNELLPFRSHTSRVIGQTFGVEAANATGEGEPTCRLLVNGFEAVVDQSATVVECSWDSRRAHWPLAASGWTANLGRHEPQMGTSPSAEPPRTSTPSASPRGDGARTVGVTARPGAGQAHRLAPVRGLVG